MLEKYVELKKKNLNPTVELVTVEDGERAIKLSWSRFDEDSGASLPSRFKVMRLDEFISDAKQYRALWQRAEEIYETLTGETFPN